MPDPFLNQSVTDCIPGKINVNIRIIQNDPWKQVFHGFKRNGIVVFKQQQQKKKNKGKEPFPPKTWQNSLYATQSCLF